MDSRLERRHNRTMRIMLGSVGILTIIVIALAVLVVLALLLSKTPWRTLRYFFLGPLQNTYYFGNMLNTAIPLMFGGLGVSLAMRAGSFNLGGEGQLYGGAFVATVCAIAPASCREGKCSGPRSPGR